MIDTIKQIIRSAYVEILPGMESAVSDDMNLLPTSTGMDSRDFVMFIVLVENKLQTHFNQSFTLIDEKAFSTNHSPFRSVAHFATFIDQQLQREPTG